MGKVLQTSDNENLKEGSTSAATTRLTETDDVIATIQQQQLKHDEKSAQPRETTNVDGISDDEDEETIELMTPAAQRAQQDEQQAQQDTYFEKLQDSAARARFSQRVLSGMRLLFSLAAILLSVGSGALSSSSQPLLLLFFGGHVVLVLALRYLLSPRILQDQQSTSPTVLLLIETLLNLQACVGNAVLDTALVLVLSVVIDHVTHGTPHVIGATLAADSKPEL